MLVARILSNPFCTPCASNPQPAVTRRACLCSSPRLVARPDGRRHPGRCERTRRCPLLDIRRKTRRCPASGPHLSATGKTDSPCESTRERPVAVGRECLVWDSENSSSRAIMSGSLNGRHTNPTGAVYKPNTVAPWALRVNTAGLIVGQRLDGQAIDVRGPLSLELG